MRGESLPRVLIVGGGFGGIAVARLCLLRVGGQVSKGVFYLYPTSRE